MSCHQNLMKKTQRENMKVVERGKVVDEAEKWRSIGDEGV